MSTAKGKTPAGKPARSTGLRFFIVALLLIVTAIVATALLANEQRNLKRVLLAFGLPTTFITDLRAMVHELQQASDVRISSKTVRRRALAGIKTAMAQGLDASKQAVIVGYVVKVGASKYRGVAIFNCSK